MASLCLNMIVKNEMQNLPRCLGSVARWIDCWVIADTGSTDGTQDYIRRFFAERNLPGLLVEFPFRDFSQARNEALKACVQSPLTFDYVLLTDADMEFVVEHASFREELLADSYMVQQRTTISYWNQRIMRRSDRPRYRGVTHEYLDVSGTVQRLHGVYFIDHATGANRTVKYERDAALLEAGLAEERDPMLRARYTFYLAQTYKDAMVFDKARERYLERAKMGLWREEVYLSRLYAARLGRMIGLGDRFMMDELKALHRDMPHRREALHEVALIARENSWWDDAYKAAKTAAAVPVPDGSLFHEDFVYDVGVPDEHSIAAYYVGQFAESLVECIRLLARPTLQPHYRERIEKNYAFAAAKLGLPERYGAGW